MLNKQQQDRLLKLARDSIEYYMYNRDFYEPNAIQFEDRVFNQILGTFVTITENGKLRGCIGNIDGIEPVYLSVARNAVNAAFFDPRFLPLEPSELDKICVEVSILSPKQSIDSKNVQAFTHLLQDKKPGVVITKDGRSGTFLPQVWEDLQSVESFLSALCRKIGLNSDCWKDGFDSLEIYQVESFDDCHEKEG